MNYFLFYGGRKMKKVKHADGCIAYYEGNILKRKHGMPSQKVTLENFLHIFGTKNLCFALSNLHITYVNNKIYTYLCNDGSIQN